MSTSQPLHAPTESQPGLWARRPAFLTSSLLIYAALVFWAFISLFPIY